MIKRPYPPEHLLDPEAPDSFEPAPEVFEWILATFLDDSSPLYDPYHDHLAGAEIGVLWTNVDMTTKMVPKVGMVELATPPPGKSKVAKALHEYFLRRLFPERELDFLMTLSAQYAAEVDDLEWCSLNKHELCHCAQVESLPGVPKYEKGKPVYGIRDHDFAGFLPVVRDFGPRSERNVEELVKVATRKPRIAYVDVSRMCGTCLRSAA
jgi:hypothetical protein